MKYLGAKAIGARAAAGRASKALAIALVAVAAALGAPAPSAASIVRNVATASHSGAGSQPVQSNEVIIEIAAPQIAAPQLRRDRT
jgi:shikimate kinase